LTVSVEAQSLPAAAAAEAAYISGYPLVLMERLRVQAPPNRLVHASAPSEEEPDMLCSSAWLDLADGPVVLSVPDTHGHYYAATLVDMWAGVFASVGPRTTGTGAGAYALCGPGWTGTPLPAEVKPLAAPTSSVRLSIRTYAGGGAEAARAVQAGFDVRPLSEWHRPRELVTAAPGPSDLPRADVDALDAAGYFAELRRLAALHGGGPEIPADAAALEVGAACGREAVRAAAEELFEGAGGGWEICYAAGHYGGDDARRAGAAYAGVADRPATDRLIARLRTDADGVPLSGRHRYRLRFEDGFLPPVRAFWSLSADGRAGPGTSWSTAGGLALERDGALSIRIQSGMFRAARTPNWLRTPPGAFELVLRLTWPGEDALERRWCPPPVTREG
jgi:hypothetical protein